MGKQTQAAQMERQNHLHTRVYCVKKVSKGEEYWNQSRPSLHPKHGSVGIIDPLNAEQLEIRHWIEMECTPRPNHKEASVCAAVISVGIEKPIMRDNVETQKYFLSVLDAVKRRNNTNAAQCKNHGDVWIRLDLASGVSERVLALWEDETDKGCCFPCYHVSLSPHWHE